MVREEKYWWDLPAAFALLIVLWTAVIRLSSTEWTEYLGHVELLVLIGLGLGLLLGQSIFRSQIVGGFAAVYSLFFVFWQLGRTMEAEILWSERLQSIMGRIGASLSLFFRNEPIQDPILFLISMAVLFWGISLYGGYQLTRKGSPWVSVLFAGLILLIVDFYDPGGRHRERYTFVFVLVTLLLTGRMYFLRSRKVWGERGVAIDSETGFGLGKSMVLSGLIIVIAAWNIPTVIEALTPGTPARQKAAKTWNWFQNRFETVVAGLEGSTVKVSDYFTNELVLGTGNPLSEDTVLIVEASQKRSSVSRYYWRGNTYDYYDDGNWSNRFREEGSVSPENWPIEYPDFEARRRVQFDYKIDVSVMGTIYAPALPLSVSRPISYIGEQVGEEVWDVVSLTSSAPLYQGDEFSITSWVSSPTITELREAGEDYPDWVLDRYLQVPRNFPVRVRGLAEAVTEGLETPYDKAAAITNYLRSTITYSDTIPAPPPDEDPIEWFLLEYKQGFCNYYATSEVMMLRSIGIPARMVAGFAQGEEGEEANTYIVRMKDTHAWPEVYFPGYGWVEFEPTVSQPDLELAVGGEGNLAEGGELTPLGDIDRIGGEFEEDPFDSEIPEGGEYNIPDLTAQPEQPAWYIFALIGGCVLLLVVYVLRRNKSQLAKAPVAIEKFVEKRGFNVPVWLFRWARHQEMTPIARMFQKVRWMLWIFGAEMEAGSTAAEQIQRLSALVPEGLAEADVLLQEYHTDIFSPHTADISRARHAKNELFLKVFQTRLKQLIGV